VSEGSLVITSVHVTVDVKKVSSAESPRRGDFAELKAVPLYIAMTPGLLGKAAECHELSLRQLYPCRSVNCLTKV